MRDDTQEQQAFTVIREAAMHPDLTMWFTRVAFAPLFGRHRGVVSVTAMPFSHRDHEPVWLTLWKGYRDGVGEDGSEPGFWLRIEQGLKFKTIGEDGVARYRDELILPVTPGERDLGLNLPALGYSKDLLLRGVKQLLTMLTAAIPVHRDRANREAAFAALNGVVTGDGVETTMDLVDGLEQMCAASDLESVEFGPYDAPGEDPFAVQAYLETEDQPEDRPLRMTIWASAGKRWIDMAGQVQALDGELMIPVEDREEAEFIVDMAGQLSEIHDVAEAIYRNLSPGRPETAFDLLNSIAFLAMNGPEYGGSSSDFHTRPWHVLADQFGAHCKLGFLAGVMLEESPFGNLNIRATTPLPADQTMIDLQVYWQQDNEEDEAEHWLAVGTSTGPAHDVDPLYPELLAGIPTEAHERVRHAIDHLHEMVHLAGSMIEARTEEVADYVDARQVGPVPESVQDEMVRSTIDETIAGLNGIARLYTGSVPS